MIFDIQALPDNFTLEADICIVGAGPVGITLALKLAGNGRRIVVLEGGGPGTERDSQALYRGQVDDAGLHPPPDHYRERRYGGSSTTWGGRLMPFDAIDFEARPYIPHSGWPIDLAAVAPYYGEATQLCEAGRAAFTIEAAFDGPRRDMIAGFTGENFTTNTLERFSRPTDFGRRYRRALETAEGLKVVLHANVTSIARSEAGGHVIGLDVRSLRGRRGRVAAGRIILAMGGLETARLLLASGLGRERDAVGRYYMCHIAGTIGTLKFSGPPDAVWNGYDIAGDGVYCRRRFALRPETQRRRGLGNFVARLHHPRIPDPRHRSGILSALYLARRLVPHDYRTRLQDGEPGGVSRWLAHAGNVISDLPATFGFMVHLLRDRLLAERKYPSVVVRPKANEFSLDFHAEHAPDPDSRVVLTDDTDALGMPRLKTDWRYGAVDIKTVEGALALLEGDIARSGTGRFDYDPSAVEQEMTRYRAYGGHHIGTARMGGNPAVSVVDKDCRVHGLDNLYVAGAAVFPTSSQANPTLTAVALALRLAEHLKGEPR
ncbi:MAG: GMC family oxidoreductase [Rhodospirillaceae bacterium]|nr:GMC family oxidoreductase [Rhodospirillaceae bacterium]